MKHTLTLLAALALTVLAACSGATGTDTASTDRPKAVVPASGGY